MLVYPKKLGKAESDYLFVCSITMNVYSIIAFIAAGKLGHNDHREKAKDLSRECAQKAAEMKNYPSSLRKNPDRGSRKESGKQKGNRIFLWLIPPKYTKPT